MHISVRQFLSRDDGVVGVIAVALIAVGTLLASAIGLLFAATAANANLQELTDTVARHAADIQRGAALGFPCDFARDYLLAEGVKLTRCRILGHDVAIEATKTFSIWPLNAQSQAGPG